MVLLISALVKLSSLTGCGVTEPHLFLPRSLSLSPRKRPELDLTIAVGAFVACCVECCIILLPLLYVRTADILELVAGLLETYFGAPCARAPQGRLAVEISWSL